MKFTDIFIRRPVLATVVSLLILVLGLRSINMLPIRQYPATENAVITVTTNYIGADPELVSGFITTPLENSIAQVNGIDYMTSESTQGTSTIKVYLRLNYDSGNAMTEINAKVNAVLNKLPEESEQPVISLSKGEMIGSLMIAFHSENMPMNNITDYLIRVVQPRLQAVEGVQTVEILGKHEFALRVWLDPDKMAAHGLTATDISTALAANNYISALGSTKGQMVTIELTADTGMHTVNEFRKLIIDSSDETVVRLEDVANVILGSESYDASSHFDGKSSVMTSIKTAPSANLLSTVEKVRKVLPDIQREMPQGLECTIIYDATNYVNSSIKEVVKTLIEALLIVTLVVFLSLGSVRSVVIPTVAIPLSLIGAFFIMMILGYTINLLTLLAMVLSIGLVVDDAIIVVENIHRHIEEGVPPLEASINGARELAGPIIIITIVLIAVYLPIGFMGGLTGALFTEFAYTLAATVAVSAVVALTLSPMMCSRSLKPSDSDKHHRLTAFADRQFNRLREIYAKVLHGTLDSLPVVGVFALIIFVSIYFLFVNSKSELAPQEDQGFIMAMFTAAPDASLQQTQLYSDQLAEILSSVPEIEHLFRVEGIGGVNAGIAGLVLKPWDERERTTNVIQPEVQNKLGVIAGADTVASQPSSLPKSGHGLPVEFVIGTTDSYERLNEVSDSLMAKAQESGLFMYVDKDLKIDKPKVQVSFDRDKAALLGLSMSDIGKALGSMLSGGHVNYFSLSGRSYKVIPQVKQSARLTADQLKDYYITTSDGSSIPLSTVVQLETTVAPESLSHFQQLNSATISAIPKSSITLGEALEKLNELAKDVLPQGYSIDYSGESRQYVQESSTLITTFIFAMVIIFLALAAQFESFRDPVIILISVPMSICGALIFLYLGVGGATLNIYTEVGLITLIGLISKNGILIVEFANDLQRKGMKKREAIEQAAATRLRPILMTSASTILGVLPLIIASGAGAAGRYNIGLIITTGMAIGTLFTLFVVPAMYLVLAHNLHPELE